MKKRGKKVVSLLLAATLTCSTVAGTMTAFAAGNPDVTYEATYTATAPKGMYTDILANANTALAEEAYTTGTMGSLWGLPFSLGTFLSGTDLTDPALYAAADAELFGDLAGFMAEKNYADVTATVITEYLAAHPELISDAEGFTACVNNFIDWLFTVQNNNIQTVLALVVGLAQIGPYIDGVVDALGLPRNENAYTSVNNDHTFNNYVNLLLSGLIPNTTTGLMNVLRTVAVPENQVALYENLYAIPTKILDLLNNPFLGLILGNLIPEETLNAIKDPLEQIQNLPTTKIIVDGEAKTVYDITALIDSLINDVIVPMIGEQLGADAVATIEKVLVDLGLGDLKLVSFDGSMAVLKLDAINMTNLANAADPEDALNVILHYLYTNLNKGANKVVMLALNAVSGLLPAEAGAIISAVATKPEAEAVAAIADALDKLANATPVTSISIDQGEAVTVLAGKRLGLYSGSVQLSATIRPDNASNKDLTWTSSHESVKVDANGLVSYKGTLDNPLTADITVTANGNTALSDTITVTFERAHATGVTLDKVYAEMYEGAAMKLTATVLPENAENKNVTWSTDNEAVAAVAADGTVTAVAPGTAKITVATVDGGLTAICVVEVRADKAALNTLLDKVAGMNLAAEDYDAEKWAAYEAALDAAETVAAEEFAAQAAVDEAVANLNAALKALPAAPELTEAKIISTSDTLEGNVIYHKVPWYRTWMSQTVELALEYTEGAQIASVEWKAANWSANDPEAKIENADNDSATIRPTFGVGTRSFWVQAVVTDVSGNTITTDPVKVRFYNWDWQK